MSQTTYEPDGWPPFRSSVITPSCSTMQFVGTASLLMADPHPSDLATVEGPPGPPEPKRPGMMSMHIAKQLQESLRESARREPRVATVITGPAVSGYRLARDGDRWPNEFEVLSLGASLSSHAKDRQSAVAGPLWFEVESGVTGNWLAYYFHGEVWKVRPGTEQEAGWETFCTLLAAAQKRRAAKAARALLAAQRLVAPEAVPTGFARRAIAKDVKMFVWQRDAGVCQECGDNRDLEFDHIIPVSMGGANTARNLQLLCEPCNRAKGGNLA